MEKSYAPPAVEEIGSLQDLTLQQTPKTDNPPLDGFVFMGIALGTQT